MKTILISFVLMLNLSCAFAQLDQITVSSISFLPGQVEYEDTILEMPVMHISLNLSDVGLIGNVTIDVMDSEGTVLYQKKEYSASQVAALWTGGTTIFKFDFLDPEQSYVVKTTLQTPEQLYIPQLINTYPQ